MQSYIKEKTALQLISDIAAMLFAFIIGLYLGHRPPVDLSLLWYYCWGVLTLIGSSLLLFFILDVYSLHKMPARFLHQVLYAGLGLIGSAILSTFTFFFFRDTVPRAVFLLFYVFSFILMVVFRYLISKQTMGMVHWRILVAGEAERSREVTKLIQSRAYLRAKVVGHVTDSPDRTQAESPCLGSLRDVLTSVIQEGIGHVIVAVDTISDDLAGQLLECMRKKVKVSNFRDVIEDITGTVPIQYLTDNWYVLELSRRDKRYFWYAKRAMDLVAACAGLCLAVPFLLMASLAIKLDSPGPVLYTQLRIGRGNKPFRVWKLRTMVQDADHNNIHWTLDHDERITRVGRLLRKLRMDEVPQLINILKGEMTLIGPRPEAVNLVDLYTKSIPYYPERHMVTPGITGWAQINYRYGNSIEDSRQKLRYDFYYIKHRNAVLDIMIFLRTIRIVLTGKGAL